MVACFQDPCQVQHIDIKPKQSVLLGYKSDFIRSVFKSMPLKYVSKYAKNITQQKKNTTITKKKFHKKKSKLQYLQSNANNSCIAQLQSQHTHPTHTSEPPHIPRTIHSHTHTHTHSQHNLFSHT